MGRAYERKLEAKIEKLQAEIKRLRDWMRIVQEDAESIAIMSEEFDTANNIYRLIIKPLKCFRK